MSLPEPSPNGRAVITGASSGIGAALAELLARRGHSLIVVARREDRLVELSNRLSAEHGVTVEVRAVDLADRDARRRLADELGGREIEVLCCNAGFGSFGLLHELDASRERDVVEVNVVAVHDLVLAILPGMVERDAGAILITGSTAGNQPLARNASYAASKAFANSLAESLHSELTGTGVACTLLAPGPVLSEFMQEAGGKHAENNVPGFVWETAARVAEEAVAGMERGKRRVAPGLPARVMGLSQYVPHGLLLPVAKRVYDRYV